MPGDFHFNVSYVPDDGRMQLPDFQSYPIDGKFVKQYRGEVVGESLEEGEGGSLDRFFDAGVHLRVVDGIGEAVGVAGLGEIELQFAVDLEYAAGLFFRGRDAVEAIEGHADEPDDVFHFSPFRP